MSKKLYSAAQATALVDAELERIKRDIAITIDQFPSGARLDEQYGLKGRNPVITVMRLLSAFEEPKP